MSGFDDLLYSGIDRPWIETYCPQCSQQVRIRQGDNQCNRGHRLPNSNANSSSSSSSHSSNPLIQGLMYRTPSSSTRSEDNDRAAASGSGSHVPFPGLESFLSSLNLNPSARSDGSASASQSSNLMQMFLAQQGLNLDDLMNQLLTQSTDYSTPPTSQEYLASLKAIPLTEKDRVQVYLRLAGVERDIFPTLAEFGLSLITKHMLTTQSNIQPHNNSQANGDSTSTPTLDAPQIHYDSQLVLANPPEGHKLTNASSLRSHIALMKRGVISFTSKCRSAEKAGAIAAIVIQTDEETWPYIMSDSKKEGGDISIPCLMISQNDGTQILRILEKEEKKGEEIGGVNVKISSRSRDVVCSVCLEELSNDDQGGAVHLPCHHLYHLACIKAWLGKSACCPLCRYRLPTEGKKLGDNERRAEDMKQLHGAMFS